MTRYVLRFLGIPVVALDIDRPEEAEEADAAPDAGPIHPAQGLLPSGEPADALIGFYQPPWTTDDRSKR